MPWRWRAPAWPPRSSADARSQHADPAAQPLKVIHSNLLYINRRVPDVPATLARYDADVVTFSELTPSHAAHLRRSSLAATYPYRIELPAR